MELKNYIFSLSDGKRIEEIEKCLNGYYEVNGVDGFQEIVEKAKEVKPVLSANGKAIALVGALSRIGTTSQCMQIIKYLILSGYRAAYVEMTNSGYIEKLKSYMRMIPSA